MLILFLRGVIIYCLVFVVIRLSGKRQVSDLQPFDLVITLLIADLASNPVSDTSVPLTYGVVPILALFLVQQLVAFLSLKSERMRAMVCGKPLVLISQGVVQEAVLQDARYTLNDLLEQLRDKDVFDLSQVAYAILETNGSLSVLKKGQTAPPSRKELGVKSPKSAPAKILVLDGKVHMRALEQAGHSVDWLELQIARLGMKRPEELLYLCLSPEGKITAQAKSRFGGQSNTLKGVE